MPFVGGNPATAGDADRDGAAATAGDGARDNGAIDGASTVAAGGSSLDMIPPGAKGENGSSR